MTSYTVLAALATLVSTSPSPAPLPSVSWTREKPGGSIAIDATPAGSDLVVAQADVEGTATLLDAIRTVKPHVVWWRIDWRNGCMTVELFAESALYANMATLALRRRFPGRSTAGTGIRQARRLRLEGFGWNVRFVLAARSPEVEP
jgi:hypothetical protein